ncbi:phospholipase [Nitrococcus mobilis Nb-231]|uniref:Phospholipase A1 n=2 Tax=Nitrococcus mobilis TaxID=35797 RepID=A4BKY7_9GAMM|nr:phospholipase [Nitrococcus mobilis Nb-231]
MLVRWFGLLVLMLIPSAVVALDAAGLQACVKLENAQERLHCYDGAMGRQPQEGGEYEQPAEHSRSSSSTNAYASVEQATAAAERAEKTPTAVGLSRRWQVTSQRGWARFFTPYKPVYALPLSYNFRPNQKPTGSRDAADIDDLEVKFQFSFKAPLWRNLLLNGGDLWFGYTQLSFWQAYNSNVSSPFRETNYEPELIYSLRTRFNLLGLHGRLLTLSLNHQSNGRSDPLSRSWNRLIGGVLFDNEQFGFQLRGWWRIPESASNDDNPNIENFVGRSEFLGVYRHNEQTFGLLLRSNLKPEALRGAVQLNWVFPLLGGPLKGYLQWFYGYGESLIDYDHVNNRFSLGLSLLDWL